MVLEVLSPISGTVVELSQVPDPVFAGAMVGPGVAIEPSEPVAQVVCPVDGEIAALHPHAFAVQNPGGSVLVHLGLDTVTLQGEPFEVHVALDEQVEAGQLAVTWQVEAIGALSSLTPIVALGATKVRVVVSPGAQVEVGDPLFVIG